MKNTSQRDPAEMSFLEHLDVLRRHLIRSVVYVISGGILVFVFKSYVFDNLLFLPLKKDFFTYRILCQLGHLWNQAETMCLPIREKPLQTLGASEQFMNHLWVSVIGGIILSFPLILRELWIFVRPAVSEKTEHSFFRFFFICLFLFIIGILFGFFILFPMSYQFLIHYSVSDSGWVETRNTLDDYITLLSTMVFVSGLVFELPVVIFFLNRMGILGKHFLKKYRRHAFIVILIFAAIITPSPDVLSQMLVALPMYGLYEVGIRICRKEDNRTG